MTGRPHQKTDPKVLKIKYFHLSKLQLNSALARTDMKPISPFRTHFLMLLLLGCWHGASSQEIGAIRLTAQENEAAKAYLDTVGSDALLFRGTEYVDYDLKIQGHQFFETDQWVMGSVKAFGKFYPNIYLSYDTHKDLLLTDAPSIAYTIQVPSDRVDFFNILGHTFIYLSPTDPGVTGSFSAGFYDLIYDGKVQFLIKRRKTHEEEVGDNMVEEWFEENDRYYLKVDGAYQKVRSKKSVLKTLGGNTKLLKKRLRKQKLKFRKEPEQAIHQAVRLYEQLPEEGEQ